MRKEDAGIAKNYLTEEELQVLNRIVNLTIEPLAKPSGNRPHLLPQIFYPWGFGIEVKNLR